MTPTPTPTPAATTNVTIHPDYGKILQTDPRYTGGEAALRAIYDPTNPRAGSAAGGRAEAIRRALISYGATPGNFADPYGDVTPETLTAATANPYGVFRQLATSYQQNLARTRNAMEQRGVYSSGATDQAVGLQGSEYGRLNYEATNTLNDLINQALSGYQTAGTTYGTGHAGLVGDVTTALTQDPSLSNVTAHLVVGSQANYGQPLYAGPDGQLYTADGTPYVPVVVPRPEPIPQPEGGRVLGRGPVL